MAARRMTLSDYMSKGWKDEDWPHWIWMRGKLYSGFTSDTERYGEDLLTGFCHELDSAEHVRLPADAVLWVCTVWPRPLWTWRDEPIPTGPPGVVDAA